MVRTTNCKFDAPGSVLNLATLFLSCMKFATEFFFLKNWTVVEKTYTFMEICQWPEISRRDLIPYELQIHVGVCTGPIRIATVNDITRKIETLVLNTPQNPYLNQATPKKCLPKLTYPKQSRNRKFQTQKNPLAWVSMFPRIAEEFYQHPF